MQTPLGLDEKTWKRRHKVIKRAYEKHNSWRKGYDSGKDGINNNANPYLKQLDHSLMKKAAYWQIGWEEAAYSLKYTKKRIATFTKEEARRKRKEEKHNQRKAEKAAERNAKRKHKHPKRRKRRSRK